MIILFLGLTMLHTRIQSGEPGLRVVNAVVLRPILGLDLLPDLLGRAATPKLIFYLFDFYVVQIKGFGVLRL